MSEETKIETVEEVNEGLFGGEETAPETVETPEEVGETRDDEAPEKPQAITFSAEALDALRQTLAAQQQAAPQPVAETPKMTPEQVREVLGQFDVDEATASALGLSSEAVQPLQKLKEAIVREAVRTMAVHQEHVRRQLDAQLAPLRQHLETQRMQELQRQFYGENKDLVGLEPLVETVYGQLAKSGVNFSSMTPTEAFKKVADETRKLKAKLSGDGQQKNNTAKQKPAVLSGGRTSGGGSKAQTQPSSQAALVKELFG